MDRGVWRAMVHRGTEIQTQPKSLSTHARTLLLPHPELTNQPCPCSLLACPPGRPSGDRHPPVGACEGGKLAYWSSICTETAGHSGANKERTSNGPSIPCLWARTLCCIPAFTAVTQVSINLDILPGQCLGGDPIVHTPIMRLCSTFHGSGVYFPPLDLRFGR